MNVGEELIAMAHLIDLLEIEMELLEREKKLLRTDGDDAGSKERAARLERRKAELAADLEEVKKDLDKLLEYAKAEAISHTLEDGYFCTNACFNLWHRLQNIHVWMEREGGTQLLKEFSKACPKLDVIIKEGVFPDLGFNGLAYDGIVDEMISGNATYRLLTLKLDRLENERTLLLQNGNKKELRKTDRLIEKNRLRREQIDQKMQELRKKVRVTDREHDKDITESHRRRMLELEDCYMETLVWLRNHWPADFKDDKDHYLARMIRSYPEYKSWCKDFLKKYLQ